MPTLDEDMSAILADEFFGTCVTLSDGSCLDGIFTDASDAAVMYGVEIEAQKATVLINTTNAGQVATKDTVTVSEADYIVEKKEKLGTGGTLLYLKTKQS